MDDAIRNRNADYRGCPDKIDWSTWDPNMHATLLFILRGKEVLLIHKKTGLGAGKVNAPGGKMEKGETAEQAAIREVREEVKIEVDSPTEMEFCVSNLLMMNAWRCTALFFALLNFKVILLKLLRLSLFGVVLMKCHMIKCGQMMPFGFQVCYQEKSLMGNLFLMGN